MVLKETLIEALAKWAKTQPEKLAWQFHDDKLEIEDTYNFKVWLDFLHIYCLKMVSKTISSLFRNLTMPQVLWHLIFWITAA